MLLFDYKLEILKYNINYIRFVCDLEGMLYEFFLKLITHSLHTAVAECDFSELLDLQCTTLCKLVSN